MISPHALSAAFRAFALLLVFGGHSAAGDIDRFTRDLDLSVLRRAAPDLQAPPETNRHLFEAWTLLPEALRTLPPGAETVDVLDLPAGPFLAVPNPVSLPLAYEQLAGALKSGGLHPIAPLVVLIHADNNVSVGCRVQRNGSTPLPLGTDLGEMPRRRLLVTPVTVQTACRTEPALVTAAARLRDYARENGQPVETRELYLLPVAPGLILFGLLTR